MVHQELILFPDMTVAENIFLGEEPRTWLGMVDAREMRRRSAAILSDLGTHIDVDQKVRDLTVADQQMVEIARALIGKDVGDSAEVRTPGGLKSYEILEIAFK